MTPSQLPDTTMNDPFSTSLDPDAGFTPVPIAPSPSISKAASDLRAAAGEKAMEIVHTAESKAASLKEKAIESAQHLRATATERAAAFKATASERANHLRDSANEQWDHTRERAKEWHITTEDYIRQNPTKSVLYAAGVGFLIGLIVRR
jgi:ElaB/YqjD/DUF883 family membrane-anchored ribosome-binding protein